MKIYIDGQNFIYKAAEILINNGKIGDKNELTKIDISGLFKNIFDEDLEILFFGAKVKIVKDYGQDILNKSQKFSDTSRKLRTYLAKNGVIFVESGKLKVRDSDDCKACGNKDYRFQEKGVDVGLAVSMVYDRLVLKADKQVLVSSDTDLIPAVKIIRQEGGNVCYVGFANRTTKALMAESDSLVTIRDQEIIEAYDRANPPKLPNL